MLGSALGLNCSSKATELQPYVGPASALRRPYVGLYSRRGLPQPDDPRLAKALLKPKALNSPPVARPLPGTHPPPVAWASRLAAARTFWHCCLPIGRAVWWHGASACVTHYREPTLELVFLHWHSPDVGAATFSRSKDFIRDATQFLSRTVYSVHAAGRIHAACCALIKYTPLGACT